MLRDYQELAAEQLVQFEPTLILCFKCRNTLLKVFDSFHGYLIFSFFG